MQEERYNPHPRRIYWEALEREPDASVIEATNKLCNELGMMFRQAQWEAYDSYCAWEAKRTVAAEELK